MFIYLHTMQGKHMGCSGMSLASRLAKEGMVVGVLDILVIVRAVGIVVCVGLGFVGGRTESRCSQLLLASRLITGLLNIARMQ